MGEPKFQRRRYETPTHPWKADRILEETAIQAKFGLKNKREVWKAKSMLRDLRKQGRTLLARMRTGQAQAQVEQKQLLARLHRIGILSAQATLDDVLALELDQILTRRLETQVYLKGLAGTPKQARQFIAHNHISLDGVRVNVPGHLVTRMEEETIEFHDSSVLSDEEHPVRPKRVEAGQSALQKLKAPLVLEPEPRGGPGGRRGPPRRGGPGGARRGPGGPGAPRAGPGGARRPAAGGGGSS